MLAAYWRHGLHELGAVLYGPGTAAQHPEVGMFATRPIGLVTEGLRPDKEKPKGKEQPKEQEQSQEKEEAKGKDDAAPSILDEHLKQVEQHRETDREPEPPQQERD
ncbi:MAG: hypothetical protein DPW13_14095 [Planctomycetes bacterium]|nr:hypothetical protein [Planctomycetota bacterium]